MPRKLPPFVERWRDRHKKLRFYFRRGKGKRFKLPPPDTPEFEPAYHAALVGAPVRTPERHGGPMRGTIAALIGSYKQSQEYVVLRSTTKKGYESRLNTLVKNHGHRSLTGLTRERIIVGILQPYADRPGQAHAMLKMLRVVIRHAINIGQIKADPTLGIKRAKLSRIRSWDEREIALYRSYWPLGTKQRTAFELFLASGQRRSDIVRMTWRDISPDNRISVTQQKTGKKLLIPLHRDALTALNAANRDHVSIFTTAYGKPHSVDGFSQWIRDAIKAAGLPLDCQPHGLRKAAGRRLAEAGASAKQIMAVLGHDTMSEAQKYCDEADQASLAEDAIAKLDGRRENVNAQTASGSLGKKSKKEGKSI